MDRLLEKLRQNMAELSVQGDDFTRQIWHMYATFEEFIDTHTIFGRPDDTGASSSQVDGPSVTRDDLVTSVGPGCPRANRTAPRRVIGGSALELTVSHRDMAASTPISASAPAAAVEFNLETASKLGSSKDDMSLLYRRHHRCRYRRARKRMDIANPLLETISAIQDACESDDHDYGEPGQHYYSTREHRLPGSRFGPDADKDSIGYAGSNSVDSGYKSSCPTPEPSDGILYGNDPGSKRGSIASLGSQQSHKPRIPMGTKVMNRHSHPQYAGRDLDHLMYLRQSILSAMQRYEQQAVASSPSPGFRPRSSSASSPGYRSASPSPSAGGGVGSSPLPQRRAHMASCPSSRTHSPCYSSASNASSNSSPGYHRSRLATAEEDIDILLYGREEELACSYVTMIEDKYRRSSVARVKKLREKSRDRRAAAESSSSSDSSCPSPTQSGRFSEVAKCMLEIIEDLQNQTQLPAAGSVTPLSPPAPAPEPPIRLLTDPESSPKPYQRLRTSSTDKVLKPGPSSADYHVYEEIMYELTTRPRAEPGPPPLPARPVGIFRTGSANKKSTVTHFMPPANRPKQRSNLYSLFREPSTRRDISQSLEQEYRGGKDAPRLRQSAPDRDGFEPEEEYGFRVPT